jgi:arylsulfatase
MRIVTLFTLLFSSAVCAQERPNIVIIMSDDMGFSDLGCYGGEIQTPHLDQLAQQGVRFTQFYNTGRCCPTRAALLTGLYSHQAGVGHMIEDKGFDGYRGELNQRCVTIAEVLRGAGYRNYVVGKWHVCLNVQPRGPQHAWPLQRGFDRYYGTLTGAGSFFDPGTLTRDNVCISPLTDPEYQPDRYYYTDAIADQAARFITEHHYQTGDRPFFLYTSFTAAHWPMHAREEDIAKYKGKYDAGYDAIRRARYERLKQLGIIDSSTQMSPTKDDWNAIEPQHRAWELRGMEVYAAMVDRMDQAIGRIVEALKSTGQYENTLLLFLQDNGGCAETVGRRPDVARPSQPTLPIIPPETLRQDIIPKQTRDGFPVLAGRLVMPGPADTYIAYGEGWANVSNTPFRLYKHWQHEGGIATPLIAHWPLGIPSARRGKLEAQPGHLIDLMATCVELGQAQQAYPRERHGVAIPPCEGVSLVPAFHGQPLHRQQPLFWEHEGNRAVRDSSWKLVANGPKGAWELYDLSQDRSEMTDVAARHPERVAQLGQRWNEWAQRVGVQPWPVPKRATE